MTFSKDTDNSEFLISKIKKAYRSETPLQIIAGNTKVFYGRAIDGEKLDTSSHSGILNYEPSELVITVRSGTKLSEINSALKDNNQMLAFEPPDYDSKSTIGGSISCGLSGSRRPFTGAARDFVLGTRIINGTGESLRFGGEVIKNVAGYDASRLITGSLGTLGVLLDISIKVLPRPETEKTLIQELSTDAALSLMVHLKRQPLPISGLVYANKQLFIRLSGTESTVNDAQNSIGGEDLNNTNCSFSWDKLDNHTLDFFDNNKPLWRVSLKPDTPAFNIDAQTIYNWAGAERWFFSEQNELDIFKLAAQANGHATLFRNGIQRDQVFQPLSKPLQKIHLELKKAFDPKHILNPGKLYAEL